MSSSPPLSDRFPYVDLRLPSSHSDFPVDPVDFQVARLIVETDAYRHRMLPFLRTLDEIHVAISAPLDVEGQHVLERLELPVRLFRASEAHLLAAQQRVWGADIGGIAPTPPLLDGDVALLGKILVDERQVGETDLDDALSLQHFIGGRLGEILMSANRLTSWAIARAVARQHNLPVADLLASSTDGPRLDTLDPRLFLSMPINFWRDRLVVPLRQDGDVLTVAMVYPDQTETLDQLRAGTGQRIEPVVTAHRDIAAALQRVYKQEFSEESRRGLLRRRPEDSAASTLTRAQKLAGLLVAGVVIAGLLLWTRGTFIVLNGLFQLFYLTLTFFYLGLASVKLGLLARLDRGEHGIEIGAVDMAHIRRADLPVYTILVPAYRESNMLRTLADALSALDYPHDRLDVKLLLEADDAETIKAARDLRLPGFIDIVTVPVSEPRTKPKACNYGLQLARGEYVVIFDVEDIPEPDQLLKVVAAFGKAEPGVACVQAKLTYFNQGQSLLTRWFTAEYVMWFDLLLPALHNAGLPIPLGGTSNHFRTAILRELGAWDPYNVTEDADLGIRLYKAGYTTAVVDTTTYEEATAYVGNWVRQRSRWLKGYMQTWLVHMRHPVALWRAMGARGFFGFHIIVGGTPVTLLLNPIYALLTTLWYLSHSGAIESVFPGWVYLVAVGNLFVGNFAFTYANMAAVARRHLWELAAWAALSPLYWTLMSVAAWRALFQLITRPSYWEKTEHGLTSAATVVDAMKEAAMRAVHPDELSHEEESVAG